ncbi:putative leader peptide [Thermomonospora echinospora]|uniref:putative leader peptide n=1 Tax=Thermomonospora echinospora TaxID=1992 RepID=UPI00389A2871
MASRAQFSSNPIGNIDSVRRACLHRDVRVQPLLTRRRHVDLVRVAASRCRRPR